MASVLPVSREHHKDWSPYWRRRTWKKNREGRAVKIVLPIVRHTLCEFHVDAQVILDTINFGSCLSLSVWWEDRGWSFWGQPVYLFISSGPTRSYQGTLSTGTRCSIQAWSQRQRGMCNSNYYYHTGLVVIHADGSSLWILQFRHHPAGVSQLSKASSYLRKVAIRLLGLNHNDQL